MKPVSAKLFSIHSLLAFFFVSVSCLSAKAQNTKCDIVSRRTVDSITYLSGQQEEGRIMTSIQRQYGLHKNNLFDYIIFTLNISTPIIEKDSLGLMKYLLSNMQIILDDNSILKTDSASDVRINEYLKPPSYKDSDYRSGGSNLYPLSIMEETESFRTILTQRELQQLLRHKLKYVQLNDQLISVPDKMSTTIAEQIKCIAETKFYMPVPKHN